MLYWPFAMWLSLKTFNHKATHWKLPSNVKCSFNSCLYELTLCLYNSESILRTFVLSVLRPVLLKTCHFYTFLKILFFSKIVGSQSLAADFGVVALEIDIWNSNNFNLYSNNMTNKLQYSSYRDGICTCSLNSMTATSLYESSIKLTALLKYLLWLLLF